MQVKVGPVTGKIVQLNVIDHMDEALILIKALSSDTRLKILALLGDRLVNVNDIAHALDITPSSVTAHIKILEEANLIRTEVKAARRGLQKLCGRTYDDVCLRLESDKANTRDSFEIKMPIGHYWDIEAHPTCGLASETSLIGLLDTSASFYDPDHVHAQLLWFGYGYVAYRFPNHLLLGTRPIRLDFSAEICSEAPLHHVPWLSDITLWINGVEVGTWTCPGDFGGERGLLTPNWWETKDSQYGLLKRWSVTEGGSFIDGEVISQVSISKLQLEKKEFIDIRLGVKSDAVNRGGLNLFGEKFGNYPEPLVLKVDFSPLISRS